MPQNQRLQFMNRCFDGFGEVIERALSNAVCAFIGDHFGEEPVLPGVPCYVGFDCCDFHSSIKSPPERDGDFRADAEKAGMTVRRVSSPQFINRSVYAIFAAGHIFKPAVERIVVVHVCPVDSHGRVNGRFNIFRLQVAGL